VLSTRIEQPLPIEAGSSYLYPDGDALWLATAEPASLWRTFDLEDWEPVDVTGLISPGPTELEWDLQPGPPVTSGDLTLVQLTFTPRDLGRLVGYPGLSVHVEAVGPGRYRVLEHHSRSAGGDLELGIVRVEETPSGLRFMDDGGATIAELREEDLGFMDAWVQGSVDEPLLGILEADRLSTVGAPWDPALGWPALFPVDTGFLAFLVGADRTVRTWQTADGRSWELGAILSDEEGRPLTAELVGVETIGDRTQVRVVRAGGSDGWISPDGEHWTYTAAPPSLDSALLQLQEGWVMSQSGSWSVSRDGATWQEVPELREVIDKWEPRGGGGSSAGLVGDALFFSVQEDAGTQQRDLWIVEFEAP
jgi:hypothetical protein